MQRIKWPQIKSRKYAGSDSNSKKVSKMLTIKRVSDVPIQDEYIFYLHYCHFIFNYDIMNIMYLFNEIIIVLIILKVLYLIESTLLLSSNIFARIRQTPHSNILLSP